MHISLSLRNVKFSFPFWVYYIKKFRIVKSCVKKIVIIILFAIGVTVKNFRDFKVIISKTSLRSIYVKAQVKKKMV